MKQDLLKGLSEEQIAKIKACKNNEEILKTAKEEGIELNDEQLEAVSGGCGPESGLVCPRCGQSSYDALAIGWISTYYCRCCNQPFYRKKEENITSAEML